MVCLFLEDIKVGDKVVPVSKTRIKYGRPEVKDASFSVVWRVALSIGQPFLYVVAVDNVRERILCNIKNVRGGDYFMEYDLEPYVENF